MKKLVILNECKQDSLRVKFEAKLKAERGSVHMWGILVEIIDIEKF